MLAAGLVIAVCSSRVYSTSTGWSGSFAPDGGGSQLRAFQRSGTGSGRELPPVLMIP
jgi:hypothetical protein